VRNTFSAVGSLFTIYLTIACPGAGGQTHRVNVFTDEQEYHRTFKDLPDADQLQMGFTLLDAHVDKGLGARYDQVTALTAVYCRKTTAINTMQKSISELITGIGFKVLSDWDPTFATLRASLSGRGLINLNPPQFQRVNLKIQVGQRLGAGAFNIDYEILSSPQEHSNSWSDIATVPEARDYVDELRVKIRVRVEQALKDHCEKATVRDIPTEEQAIQAIATKLKMKPADIEAVRAAIGAEDE